MIRNIAIHTHGEIPPRLPSFETDQTLVWYYDPTDEGVSNSLCLRQEYVSRICSPFPRSMSDRPVSMPILERRGTFPNMLLTSLGNDNPDIYDCMTNTWRAFPDSIRKGSKQYVILSDAIAHLKEVFGSELRIHILACGKRWEVPEKRETHFLVKGGARRKTRRRKTRRRKTRLHKRENL